MKKYLVERTRWINTDEQAGIFRGYDETYYDEVYADYYGVDDHGTAVFYRRESNNTVLGYAAYPMVSYADGQWLTIKEAIDENQE